MNSTLVDWHDVLPLEAGRQILVFVKCACATYIESVSNVKFLICICSVSPAPPINSPGLNVGDSDVSSRVGSQ
jgi:hypothetical protein